eukprot:EG_transcript_45989
MHSGAPKYQADELEGMSLPQLQALAAEDGIDLGHCATKAEAIETIMQVTAEGRAGSQPTPPEFHASREEALHEVEHMPARELRQVIQEAGLPTADILERPEFVERAADAKVILEERAHTTGA